jgi:hypothetical protein
VTSPHRLVSLFLLLLLVVSPAVAAPPHVPARDAASYSGLNPSGSAYLLGAANNAGLFSSFFTTDVYLINPNRDGKVVVIAEALSTAGAIDGRLTYELAPGGFIVVRNILGQMGTRGGHVLLLRVDDTSSTAATKSFNAWGYTLTSNPIGPGSYGVSLPSITIVPLGPSVNGSCVGVEISPTRRTNVGVVNGSATPLAVTVRAVDAAGQTAGEQLFSVPAWGFTQVSAASFVSGTLERGALLFRDGTGPYVGYMVVNDNASNDALFEVALPDE